MHLLILGARAPACLEWARAARKEGCQVTVADSLSWPLTRFSKAGIDYVRLPEPKEHTLAWLQTLKKIVLEKNIDCVIPVCEEVFYLAWGANLLKPHCEIFTSDFNLLEKLHHKGKFADMTRGWNLQTPKTYLIQDKNQLKGFQEGSKSFVFKPAYSRFATNTLISPEAQLLDTLEPTEKSPWVAQEFIQGKEHCSFSIVKNGEVIAHSCYHPKYRVGKGSGIYFEVTSPPEILDFVKQFAKATHYTGQVGFDFMESTEGKFYALECNPRATSGVHLFNDQPKALTSVFSPQNKLPIFLPTSSPRMSSMAMLLFAITRNFWKRRFWKDFMNASDVISHVGEGTLNYAQLLCLAEICTRAIRRRKGLLEAATSDIEWDGQTLCKLT